MLGFEAKDPDQAKPAILSYGFGMGTGTLLDNNPGSFRNRAEAKKVIARFRNQIREKAHRQSYLVSRHGAIRWFFDVLRWDAQTGRLVAGDDTEAGARLRVRLEGISHMRQARVLRGRSVRGIARWSGASQKMVIGGLDESWVSVPYTLVWAWYIYPHRGWESCPPQGGILATLDSMESLLYIKLNQSEGRMYQYY